MAMQRSGLYSRNNKEAFWSDLLLESSSTSRCATTTSLNQRLQRVREAVPHFDVGGAIALNSSGTVLLDMREPGEKVQVNLAMGFNSPRSLHSRPSSGRPRYWP
jgi:hypothetical protein